MTVTNAAVSRVFRLIADLLEVKGGDDAAKSLTYRRAARSVEGYPEDVTTLDAEGRLREIPGVGDALSKKISELIATGRVAYLDRLMTGVSSGVLDLLRIQGVGAKTAGVLWRELGLDSVDRLEEAARSGALQKLSGFGPKKEQAILEAIASYRKQAGRHPLGLARPVGEALVEAILAIPSVSRASVVGSTRRARETVSNLDLVVATTDPAAVAEALAALPEVREAKTGGTASPVREVELVLHYGLAVRARLVSPERYWGAVTYFTGSPAHGDALAARAGERGLGFGADGLTEPDGRPANLVDEEGLYRRLDLEFVPPELREGLDEIDVASRRGLPRLIEPGDIRGDLHIHTNWSDGQASLEEMAEAARRRGYEYLAITDHSKALSVAHGLDEKRVLEQKEAIDAYNARAAAGADQPGGDGPGSGASGGDAPRGGAPAAGESARPFRLLSGVEVDILPSGELDLPDAVLAELDVVVASVHLGLRQDAAKMTERLVGAAKNEHVDIIGHPTGRLIGEREASRLDLGAVLEEASRHATAVEINASPERLDLGGEEARLAKDKGCLFAISTDAHNTRVLDVMDYGVRTARRGWLEASDIVNTRPLGDLRKVFRRVKPS